MVTGHSQDEHLRNLEGVLERLQWHGIGLEKSKCEFLLPSVEYLGHRIDAEGLHATDDKLAAINDSSHRNIQELRLFLGLLNYYGKFIPNLASILHPLNRLLCKYTP